MRHEKSRRGGGKGRRRWWSWSGKTEEGEGEDEAIESVAKALMVNGSIS